MLRTPESSVTEVAKSEEVKGFSCLLCRQRKVRCDQHQPCSNCVKAGKRCSFVAPVRGKRKRTKAPREGLHAKLRRYEELLKSYGAQLEPTENDEDDTESDNDLDIVTRHNNKAIDASDRSPSAEKSRDPYRLGDTDPVLVTKGDASRYLDGDVWARLGEQNFKRSDLVDLDEHVGRSGTQKGVLKSTNAEQNCLLVGDLPTITDLTSFHPPLSALPALQKIFVERVDPLMKVLHLPTFWSSMVDVVQNPYNVSQSREALVFSFYLVTTSTFEEDECVQILGADKSFVSDQYRLAARQALVNAEFLSTSNIETLQAMVLFMMGVRGTYRSDNLYMFSAVAVRLARRMGLHRDGTSLGLPFFETEMRRRLWWHVAHLDFRLADALSTRPSLDLCACDTRTPLNVEDADFGPDTSEAPPERNSITAVAVCRMRCELVEWFRQFVPSGSTDVRWEILIHSDLELAEKDALIRQLEDRLEREFLRYCDPAESLHTLISIMIRSSIAKMKLFAHNPRRYADGSKTITQSDRDVVFSNASKLLEYATLVPNNKSLGKYMWQINTTYLWNTILYMLIEARHRKTGPEVDRMWHLISKLTSKFPHLFEGSAGAVENALRKWILEVWDDYVMALRDARLPEPMTPKFVDDMRGSLRSLSENMPQTVTQAQDNQMDPVNQLDGLYGYVDSSIHSQDVVPPTGMEPLAGFDFSDILSFEMDPNEWSQWDTLISGGIGFS